MATQDIKHLVENAIKETFLKLASTDKHTGVITGVCIRYPQKRGNDNNKGEDKDKGKGRKFRVSEQEAKQVFLNKLYEEKIAFSVETPTKEKYRFHDEDGKENPKIDESGRAAQVDVSVYDDDGALIHHIEFKAGNPKEGIVKDILKLKNEGVDGQVNYFVHILESATNKTIESIVQKYKTGLESYEKSDKKDGKEKRKERIKEWRKEWSFSMSLIMVSVGLIRTTMELGIGRFHLKKLRKLLEAKLIWMSR